MRERSSAQGESAATAPGRLPSVLLPASALGHLSLPAISVVCVPLAHSLGSLLLFSFCFSFGSPAKVCQSWWQSS
jgi:hypothetical protein